MKGVRIRRAGPADYDAACELYAEGDAPHREHLPHIFRKPRGPARAKEYALQLLTRADVGFFVAESEERLLGMVVVAERSSPDISILVPRRYAQVSDLVVTEAWRRRGVGRALMDRAERWAVQRGLGEVELSVYEFNRGAIALYQDLGYHVSKQTMTKQLDRRGDEPVDPSD